MNYSRDIEGTDFYFEIKGIKYPDVDKWLSWCEIDIRVTGRYFNYRECSSFLSEGEVVEIRDKLNDLINDKINDEFNLSFLEPDLAFVLQPKYDLRNSPNIWNKDEQHKIIDISVDIIFDLRNNDGVYVGQQYLLPLNREDIVELINYLDAVILTLEIGKNRN